MESSNYKTLESYAVKEIIEMAMQQKRNTKRSKYDIEQALGILQNYVDIYKRGVLR